MAAAKSQQDASVLATLIQLRADVNARARTGLVAMSFCRTPEQVKVMVEHRADMPPLLSVRDCIFWRPRDYESTPVLPMRHQPDGGKQVWPLARDDSVFTWQLQSR